MAEQRSDVWFEYAITRGRITAVPVNASGWFALAAALLAPLVILLLLSPAAFAVHPLLFVPLLLGTSATALVTLFKLVKRKGRRVPP